MNIYESQPELENNKTKTKKLMIIIGVAIVILFVLSIGLIFYISYIEKNKFKCYIDGTKISTKSDMIVVDENKNNIYVSLEDIMENIKINIQKILISATYKINMKLYHT